MSNPCHGAHGAGTKYTYAELEGLWINAGGKSSVAPIMAAIAEAESGGCSAAENPSGASGLWQILGQPFPGDVWNPAENAKMAVSKYKSQGLGAWETYTNGAYKAFLSGRTTPDLSAPSPSGGTTTTADIQPYSSDTCVWGFPGISMPVIGNVGQFCIISKSQARALAGGLLIAGAGLLLILPGLAFITAAAGLKALGAAGPVLEKAGAAVALIPGAEAAGVAIAGAGRAGTSSAQATQRRRAARDTQAQRTLGEPRENPELREGRGAVRETPAETRRRQSASRSRARRAASPAGGRAASASEAGF